MSNFKPLIPPSLPANFCPQTLQQLFDQWTTAGIYLDGETKYVISENEPAGDDRDKLWVKKDASGGLVGVYLYGGGQWIREHPVPAGGSERRLWVGNLTTLQSYDGGNSQAVGAASGPIWEEDPVFAGLFPVGVGTFDNRGNVGVLGTGGVDEHALSVAELPSHSHGIDMWQRTDAERNLYGMKDPDAVTPSGVPDKTVQTQTTGGGDAHTNLPPYIGAYFIRRTARIYLVG